MQMSMYMYGMMLLYMFMYIYMTCTVYTVYTVYNRYILIRRMRNHALPIKIARSALCDRAAAAGRSSSRLDFIGTLQLSTGDVPAMFEYLRN